ncbi:CDGSH iron-sulfur domain-containing protein [Arthrobacter zhaoguopingii]|uniref:CDGSH iron-sulfur domain-containing protein n=1 Tax=Arthrobacter zhaoguopingii TaxID=2681491 RepID=UPI00135C8D1A|nr:CDGSH iron-sulfur domain-containing protein [Arthrobacter zhaoguopingii]
MNPADPAPRAGAARTGTPAASIVACPDGPLLVRGEFEVVTPDGEALPRTRRTVALCRCGASVLKPYCDGSHKLIGFKTEPPAP